MTLSNFDWTDKNSPRWFIMLPTGHEGPYSLEDLATRFAKKRIGPDTRIWAEGLESAVPLKEAFLRNSAAEEEEEIEEEEEDLPPPLPPLPEEDIPPMPMDREDEEVEEDDLEGELSPPVRQRRMAPFLALGFITLLILIFSGWQWIKGQEEFSIRRYPRMSLELHERIVSSLDFHGWDQNIFFKEFTPDDLSQIWLVTSGYQTCDVGAEFTSLPEKLLSMDDKTVSFRTSGKLQNHVVQFSEFQFTQGSRIIPGMYEMLVRAENCSWDGLAPQLANGFMGPESTYEAKVSVVLYGKGPDEFQRILAEVQQKKQAAEQRAQFIRDQFWDDLQQKLQTLLATSLQIEQFLVDFMEGRADSYGIRLPGMVDEYTKKFGHFLTNFVSANEEYFQDISQGELREITVKKNYEELIRQTSKTVGQTAMEIIEECQRLKKPTSAQLSGVKEKVLRSFANLKERINQRIIEVTEDRSSPL